ncbi:MAG: proteic killer suppression [Geobacteraceae bacterium]|nr:MAG: proteic killer suppression [Geobacteraceae bacterium]
MVILFKTAKLEKEFNESKQMVKRHGPHRAKLLQKRLFELRAATVMEDIFRLPQARCHELHGNRKGTLSVDLDHPFRLIFEPADEPIPTKPDGGLDWTKVTTIRILGIEDTHE